MNRSGKVLLLILIIVIASILSAFMVIGIFNSSPTIAKTRTLEAVTWSMPVPTDTRHLFEQSLAPTYADSEVSVSCSLFMAEYHGDTSSVFGGPYLAVPAEINANVASSSGFVYDINVSFHQAADWMTWTYPLNFSGSYLQQLASPRIGLSVASVDYGPDAFMYFIGQNHSRSVDLGVVPIWGFTSSNAVHSMEADVSITYFNGTVYKRLVQPFQLEMHAGQHYLEVDTIVEAGGGDVAGIVMTMDAKPYTSPVSLSNVTDGIHQISFPSSIYRNSTEYHFDTWWDRTNSAASSNPLISLNFTYDHTITAYYRQ